MGSVSGSSEFPSRVVAGSARPTVPFGPGERRSYHLPSAHTSATQLTDQVPLREQPRLRLCPVPDRRDPVRARPSDALCGALRDWGHLLARRDGVLARVRAAVQGDAGSDPDLRHWRVLRGSAGREPCAKPFTHIGPPISRLQASFCCASPSPLYSRSRSRSSCVVRSGLTSSLRELTHLRRARAASSCSSLRLRPTCPTHVRPVPAGSQAFQREGHLRLGR